jgi:uncharacterized membrane protein YoaK (UPF0700 family)
MLREWLREFGCENACDLLVDAGFDSLAMMATLDDEEVQMLEISLKDLPPIKQRRIVKKALELAESDVPTGKAVLHESDAVAIALGSLPSNGVLSAEEPLSPLSPGLRRRTANSAKSDALPAAMMLPLPVSDKKDVTVVRMSDARPAGMMSLVPVPADDTDDSDISSDSKKVTIRIASNSTATTAASSRVPSSDGKPSDRKRSARAEHSSVQVNNFLPSVDKPAVEQYAVEKPSSPVAKVAPRRIDEVHPLHHIALMGGFLCLISGWLNGVGFRGFDGGVTHITGTATKIGLKFATQQKKYFIESSAKVFCFCFGAAIAGAYLGRGRLFKGGPRYAHLLLLVAACILGAFCAEEMYDDNFSGKLLLVGSSGILNALTSIYSGAVLKTATVTSTVTDIGVEIGNIFFQGDYSGCWKLKLLVTMLLSYIAGGFLGGLCFDPEAITGPDFVRAEAQASLDRDRSLVNFGAPD